MPGLRAALKSEAIHRGVRHVETPLSLEGKPLKVSQYFGQNTFDFRTAPEISSSLRAELLKASQSGAPLNDSLAQEIATIVLEWATSKGATHFCHWFQPLTGGTAEKHDAFLDFSGNTPVEKLSASQLVQGEPDASSFPSGGSRSTFEARGYTSWDMTSPLFLMETMPGKTLCIPTAFVSYHGDALDVKTPLLRSTSRLSQAATAFCQAIGDTDVTSVHSNCGCEQEYFLVDKSYFYARPDLVMTGRTLVGAPPPRHQQLEDHYFASIPERVRHFMEELNIELHKLGIPAKTQHNEVAPGQFELAPIFEDSNVANDHNQLTMSVIKTIARRHHFEALLHEKPYAQINGSGKHLNWSLSTDTGLNLLEPGPHPHSNHRFLCMVSIILEALMRHGDVLRMTIASHGNDHRLGANEAPPSIISAYVGSYLETIFRAILAEESFNPTAATALDMGVTELATLKQDNTDRNRTSPFAFTGNKFEFRAVGSSQPAGFPISILNTAVAEVIIESTAFISKQMSQGKTSDEALSACTLHWLQSSEKIIFNGDGYSQEWVEEAKKRGLPNLRNSVSAFSVFEDKDAMAFLKTAGVYSEQELQTRHKVLLKKYVNSRLIEFSTLSELVHQRIIPSAIEYRGKLSGCIEQNKTANLNSKVECHIHNLLSIHLEKLFDLSDTLDKGVKELRGSLTEDATVISDILLPLSEKIAEQSNEIESLIPEACWTLPKYYDMLFIK